MYASVLSPEQAASSSDQAVSSPDQAAWLKDLCVLITNDQPSASEDRSKTKITLNTALRLCTELLANAPYFYAVDAIIDQVVSRGYSAIVELMLAKNTAIAEEEIARLIELAQAQGQDYTATRLMHIKARLATELSEGVQSFTAMPEAQLEHAAAEPQRGDV